MTNRRGFTLIDTLITVTILAVLAALVLPQFSTASDEARSSRVLTDLQMVRGQLALYKLHHHGKLPTLAQMWGNLTGRTSAAGEPVVVGGFGPYMKKPPVNAFNQSSVVVAPGAETASAGWTYDETTGKFNAVGFNEQTRQYTAPAAQPAQ